MGVIKLILKTISLIVLISFVISAVSGYFIFMDVNELRTNWPNSDKILLLAGDDVYAGMITKLGQTEEAPVLIENLDDYQAAYDAGDYETILGSNYKLFILSTDMFEKTEDLINLGSLSITKKTTIEAIESENPHEVIADAIIANGLFEESQKELLISQFERDLGNSGALKSALFGILIQEEVNSNALFLIKELQGNNVKIYPDMFVFKLFRLVPFSLMESFAEKAFSAVEEKLPQ